MDEEKESKMEAEMQGYSSPVIHESQRARYVVQGRFDEYASHSGEKWRTLRYFHSAEDAVKFANSEAEQIEFVRVIDRDKEQPRVGREPVLLGRVRDEAVRMETSGTNRGQMHAYRHELWELLKYVDGLKLG